MISKIAPGKRAPYSARQARPAAPEADAHVRRVRRKLAANVAANAERERDAAALAAAALSAAARSPPSKSSKREQRAAAKATKASKGPAPAPAWPEPFDPDSDIVLPNLYDPTLGPATQQLVRRRPIAGGVNDAKAQSKESLAWTRPDGTPYPSSFTFSSPPGPFVLARLDELEAERDKVNKARALLLERAKELEAARRDVAAATGALATTTAANNAATAKRKGKTFASRGTQTDPVASSSTAVVKRAATATTLPLPPTPLPPLLNNAKTANKNAKGKKKRAAHANANNIHHRDNYVPSRMPGSAAQAREQASAALDYLDGIGLVDPASAFNPHPQVRAILLSATADLTSSACRRWSPRSPRSTSGSAVSARRASSTARRRRWPRRSASARPSSRSARRRRTGPSAPPPARARRRPSPSPTRASAPASRRPPSLALSHCSSCTRRVHTVLSRRQSFSSLQLALSTSNVRFVREYEIPPTRPTGASLARSMSVPCPGTRMSERTWARRTRPNIATAESWPASV